MGHRCTTCGFHSTDPAFFREEAGGLWGEARWVCDGCHAYQIGPRDKATRNFFLFLAVFGLIVIAASLQDNATIALNLTIIAVTYYTSIPFRIFLHEMAHALTAKACGSEVLKISLGSGPVRKRLSVLGMPVEICHYVYVGGLTRFFRIESKISKIQKAAIIATGPMSEIVFGGLALYLAYVLDKYKIGYEWLAVVFATIGISQIISAVSSLTPSRSTEVDGVPSDGWQLLNMWKASPVLSEYDHKMGTVSLLCSIRRFEKALTLMKSLEGLNEHKIQSASQMIHCLSRARGDVAALDYFEARKTELETLAEASSQDDVQRLQIGFLWANVAWCCLKSDDPRFNNLIDAYSNFAFQNFSKKWEARGTRGAFLISTSEAKRGLQMLTRAIRESNDWIDRGDFCVFLSKAWSLSGDEAKAASFLKLRTHCIEMARLGVTAPSYRL